MLQHPMTVCLNDYLPETKAPPDQLDARNFFCHMFVLSSLLVFYRVLYGYSRDAIHPDLYTLSLHHGN
jgi:hypothetical protein